MKLLDRYISKNVLLAIGLVTLMLTGLQIFILLVNQHGDIGKLDYGIKQVLVYVLMELPYEVYLFFPMASLLGCLIGLGILANNSELVVMRAAGMSIKQITAAVIKAAFILILVMTLLGETLVPYLSHTARDYKIAALSGGSSLRTTEGLWLHYGNDFILIGLVLPNAVLENINQFRFDKNHHLRFARSIEQARYANYSWTAYNVKQTEFLGDHTKAQQFASLPWDVPVKPQILKISSINPNEMTLHQLNQYLREQSHNKQNVHSYQLAFLQRIAQPLSTLVMMILAIPFIFGPLRSSTMGSKLLVGATVGFSFHIMNSFLGPISTVYQWPPALAAFGPTVIFALLGLYLMKRVR